VLLVGAALAGCASTRSIAEIQQYPGRFDDDRVTVRGVVTTSWSVPLVPVRFYRVDDGTGEMTVIASQGRVPARGARVKVRGRVGEVASIGGRTVGLHLRQEDLDIDRR
jgi:hypothetical protein